MSGLEWCEGLQEYSVKLLDAMERCLAALETWLYARALATSDGLPAEDFESADSGIDCSEQLNL